MISENKSFQDKDDSMAAAGDAGREQTGCERKCQFMLGSQQASVQKDSDGSNNKVWMDSELWMNFECGKLKA